jgi:hypothetical protein
MHKTSNFNSFEIFCDAKLNANLEGALIEANLIAQTWKGQ